MYKFSREDGEVERTVVKRFVEMMDVDDDLEDFRRKRLEEISAGIRGRRKCLRAHTRREGRERRSGEREKEELRKSVRRMLGCFETRRARVSAHGPDYIL
jgi:hypothetical protein